MALITAQTHKTRKDIPHEADEWVELRPLGWHELDEAKMQQGQQGMRGLTALPDSVLLKMLDDDDEDEDARRKARERIERERAEDPRKEYDQLYVLQCGIIAWSYGAKVSDAKIAQLDRRTADWAFGEIVTMSVLDDAEGKTSAAD